MAFLLFNKEREDWGVEEGRKGTNRVKIMDYIGEDFK